MKTRILVLFAVLCAAVQVPVAQAITFDGSMLFTVTDTNVSQFAGATFDGLYTYESETSDGSFVNGAVHGVIDAPAAFKGPYDLSMWAHDVSMTVVDGSVTAFHFSTDIGPVSIGIYQDMFALTEAWDRTYVKGTVDWIQPQSSRLSARVSVLDVPDVVDVPATVPDGAPSIYLLLIGLCGLAACAHRCGAQGWLPAAHMRQSHTAQSI